jgi:energy-coupling factor transport system ATP-binding protein
LADRVLALDGAGAVIDVGDPSSVLARSRDRMEAAGIWLPDGSSQSPGSRAAGPSSNGAVVAEAHGVGFGYDRTAPVLHDVDMTVRAGDRLALVGPNGSGKTTLARLLVGLLRPTSGRIRLLDEDPSRLPPAVLTRRAGYVFQDPEAGFLMDTVADELDLGLTPDARAAAPGLMERLGLPLERFGSRNPHRLSGGEARRLSLAVTLVRHPTLLVLDEPTFGQDRRGYEGLLGILRERLDDGAALVAATHDQRFVTDVARRVVVVRDGRVGERT